MKILIAEDDPNILAGLGDLALTCLHERRQHGLKCVDDGKEIRLVGFIEYFLRRVQDVGTCMYRCPEIGRVEAAEVLDGRIDELLRVLGVGFVIRPFLLNTFNHDDLGAITLELLDQAFLRLGDDEVISHLGKVSGERRTDLQHGIVDDCDTPARFGVGPQLLLIRDDRLRRRRDGCQTRGGGKSCCSCRSSHQEMTAIYAFDILFFCIRTHNYVLLSP